jgi:aldehyde dehydrogenase (NAD+)
MSLKEAPLELLPEPGLLIGAERFTATSGGSHEHVYAATGKPTSHFALAGPAEIDAAVAAARAALPGWRALPASERRDMMLRLSDLMERNAHQIGMITTLDNGIPIMQSERMARTAAGLFRYNAGWCDKVGGEIVPVNDNALDYVLDEPYGVVGVILPWNGPVTNGAMVMGPALAAGNTIVVKPPELAPYALIRTGELFAEAGFPPGVVNIVPAGPEGGEALVAHPGVDKIHFTGSGPTAKRILATALQTLKPVGLELGGKSASVIFADAEDLQIATQNALFSSLIQLSGQGCINGSRLLVERSVYDTVVQLASAMASQLPVGDPQDPATMIGPVVNEAACTRIMGMIDRARDGGATLVSGGSRMDGDYADGYYIQPTVFADVDPDSELAQVEVFGPVLAIIPFDTEDEAVRIANSTDFGLAAYVATGSVSRVHRLAAALDAGAVWANGFTGLPFAAPFGGNKQSGYGRLGGIWGIREFTRPKNVWVAL